MMLMIGGAAGAALTWAGITYGGGNSVAGKYPGFAKITEARKIIEEENVTFSEEDALNGYFSGGIDQFSGYAELSEDELTPAEYVNTSGTALASGFAIDKAESGNILITSAEEDKAAYICGLRVNDEITEIDGLSVSGTGFENIANKLLGKQDTECELKVLRDGKEQSITFKRDNDPMRSVDWENRDGIGYIRIKDVNGFAAGNMSQAAKDLKDLKGCIIDVRNNTGGATNVCTDLLKNIAPGEVFVMKSFNGEETRETVTTDPDVISGPVVILVNRNTASCAEAIAVAVKKFNHEAVIVGERSYGKGVYQKTVELEAGGNFRYTTGYFWIDGADKWDQTGIVPDKTVDMDPAKVGTDEDIQLKEALEILG